MKFTDYMKEFIKDYLIIFAIVVILITVLRQIFVPYQYFELKDIFIFMVCALVANLPSVIFYSPKEISEEEMRLKIIFHFVALEIGLITLSNVMGWVTGVLTTALFALQIAVIYVLVRFLIWREDSKSTHQINERLMEIKNKSDIK